MLRNIIQNVNVESPNSSKLSFLLLKINLLVMLSANVIIYVLNYNFISKKMASVVNYMAKSKINTLNLLI